MKKKVLLLVGLMLCLLLVGCGKSSDSPAKPINMIPDPSEYFAGAEITLLVNDEDGFYYMIKKYNDSDFDKYIDACMTGIFTDVDYSTTDDKGKIYYIYDFDKKYRLDCTMDNDLGIINIICNKQ